MKIKYSKIFRSENETYSISCAGRKKIMRPCETSKIRMQRPPFLHKVPFFCVGSWGFCSPLTPPSENNLQLKSTFIPQSSSQTLTTMLETLSALWDLPVQEFLVTGYSQAFQLLCFLVRMDFFIYGHWFRWTFIYMVFIFMDIQQSHSCQLTVKTVCSPRNISENWQKHMLLPVMSN